MMLAGRARAGIGALAAFCVVGCRSVVEIDLPFEEGMAAIVVGLVHEDEARFFAHSIDAFDPNDIPALVPYEGAARVYVLYYRASLDELELPIGELPQARPNDTGVPLPDFATGYFARVEGGDAAPWVDLDTSGAAIPFQLPTPPLDYSHCIEPEIEVTHSPMITGLAAAVATSEDEVIGLDADGDVFRVTTSTVQVIEPVLRLEARSAARGPGGDIYVGDIHGSLYLGHPERGYTLIKQFTNSIKSISTGPTPDGLELFLTTADGLVHHFLGGVWRQSGLPQEKNFGMLGAVEWMSVGQAFVVGPNGKWFGLAKGGVLDFDDAVATLGAAFVAQTIQTDGRVALLDDFGSLYEATTGSLRDAGKYENPRGVSEMARYGDGIIYVREGGQLIIGGLDRPQCPLVEVGVATDVWSIVPLGTGAVAFALVREENVTLDANIIRISGPPP